MWDGLSTGETHHLATGLRVMGIAGLHRYALKRVLDICRHEADGVFAQIEHQDLPVGI